ncbi:MAG TPA: hypothetical protein VFJ16_01050 [Longimicrobium sp.]|nr:hypothetical protein [Longimicrobium sp.]
MVVHPTPAPAPTPESTAHAATRVRRARPDLAPGHALFRAAVLMLRAPAACLNIDRLTRETGFTRQFVAACARRLYDNGVWRDGAADYAAPGPEAPAFWNDAAVAVGGLCRRMGDAGPEWAPPGTWSKPYEYVAAARGPGLAIAYRDALAPVEDDDGAGVAGAEALDADSPAPACSAADLPAAADEGADDRESESDGGVFLPRGTIAAAATILPLATPAERERVGERPPDAGAPRPVVVWLGPAARTVASRDLFPGADWLR